MNQSISLQRTSVVCIDWEAWKGHQCVESFEKLGKDTCVVESEIRKLPVGPVGAVSRPGQVQLEP